MPCTFFFMDIRLFYHLIPNAISRNTPCFFQPHSFRSNMGRSLIKKMHVLVFWGFFCKRCEELVSVYSNNNYGNSIQKISSSPLLHYISYRYVFVLYLKRVIRLEPFIYVDKFSSSTFTIENYPCLLHLIFFLSVSLLCERRRAISSCRLSRTIKT